MAANVCDDLTENTAHLAAVHPLAAGEAVHDLFHPVGNQPVGRPVLHLIGADLIGDVHDEVAVHHGVDQLAHQRDGEGKAGVGLQAKLTEITGMYSIRIFSTPCAAGGYSWRRGSAAGLGDEQGDLVRVVAAVLDRVHKLADHQQGGIAGVVVDIFQPSSTTLRLSLFSGPPCTPPAPSACGTWRSGWAASAASGWCTPSSSPW